MTTSTLSLDILRRYAIRRTLFTAASVPDAIAKIGFVQIDPINAPAPAHDLILRHRVPDYKKGDVEQVYPQSSLEEAFFINHGYIPRELATKLWSNKPPSEYLSSRTAQVAQIKKFAQQNPEIHPKILNQHIGSTTTQNNWSGRGQEGTQILQRMHNSGQLRIVRREKGQRVYGLTSDMPRNVAPENIVEAALHTLAQTYAPFTHASLIYMMHLLTQSRPDLKPHIQSTLKRAHELLDSAELDDQRWYWPLAEQELLAETQHLPINDTVRLLTPFDPLVWDRTRFKAFWGWTYKLEAYKPAHQRQLGYYALPLMWRDECIGWGNLTVVDGALHAELGYVTQKPMTKVYQQALEKELRRFANFAHCHTGQQNNLN
ncbi:hypothetical protein GCM10009007_07410 [Formosimonas limnophila]|uniref:Winged helix-turn-helix domain-containing protein n=1 Tax=Formosimonas limnophila TaxID=1384487 RepID=A0A8J3CKF7_9BURK|nr:crosslink repair DNA glycosylase YcaQ family protein [Formosimonas limnophila]GHA69105.1 hypothetical protein GCM10009007_07410 [Formosimonas limnophila]